MSAANTLRARAIGSFEAIAVHMHQALLLLRRRRIIVFTLALLGLPVVIAAVALAARAFGAALFRQTLTLYTDFLLLLVPAIHLAPAVGEEIDARTFTYVFARPAARWTMPVGKLLATVAVLSAVAAMSVLLTYFVSMLRDLSEVASALPLLGRGLLLSLLGPIAFGALSMAVGTIFPRRPVVATLVYLLVVDGIFGHIPGFLKVVSLSFHLRVVAGIHQPDGAYDPNPDMWFSVLVLIGASALLTWLGSLVTGTTEYRTDK